MSTLLASGGGTSTAVGESSVVTSVWLTVVDGSAGSSLKQESSLLLRINLDTVKNM